MASSRHVALINPPLRKGFRMLRLKTIIISIIISGLVIGESSALYKPGKSESSKDIVPKRLIVKFNRDGKDSIDGQKGRAYVSGLSEFRQLNESLNVKKVSPFLDRTRHTSAIESFESVYILNFENGDDLKSLRESYAKLPGVEYAEIDQIAQYFDSPDDALYQHQWNLNNTGQEHYHVMRYFGNYNDELILTRGLDDADIDADEVFQNPPDNTSAVVVAIIDTGVDVEHPDLADNIWINPGEIAGDGIDNDNNGFIDDINGWNFGGSLSNIGEGDNDPADEYGHGTHCAGIVAAVTNNGIGIAGITDNCQIMAVKIDPLPFVSIIARSIIYAADNGADIINMSFGAYTKSDLIEDALSYAKSRGVVLCAAAGNDGTEEYNHPASSEYTIAVGATNDSGRVTSFSTYGDVLNICAPGLAVLSLRADNTDMYSDDREDDVHIIDEFYYLASGTSMSCPHVVGAAAYLRAVSPGLSPDRVQEILEQSADDIIDPYGAGWNYPGWDRYSGYGQLNINQALQAVPNIRARIDYPDRYEILSGTVFISGTADGTDFSGYAVAYGEGKEPEQWTEIGSSNIPITDGALAGWNTDGLSGVYTIRLAVSESNYIYRTVYTANDQAVEIISPQVDDIVYGITPIYADAYAPDFERIFLEYAPAVAPGDWTIIDSISVPLYRQLATEWSTGELDPGEYILRLRVILTDKSEISDEIQIEVDDVFNRDFAWKVPLTGQASIMPNYGDFDNDGTDEIVVGTSEDVIFFNADGTMKTEGVPDLPFNNYMIPVAVGDLDGDNIDDLVALGYEPPIVYSYPSSSPEFKNYLANYPGMDFTSTEYRITKLFLKDIDNDGFDEIMVHIYKSDKPKTFIIESDGTMQKELDYISAFLPVDLDGDGTDELYAYNKDFSVIRRIDADGNMLDELVMEQDGESFFCQSFSACDIDGDSRLELIVFGYYDAAGYYLHAFNEGFQPVPGWPHSLGIDNYVIPTSPVFGDIDNNGDLEYVTTFFDLDVSYVMAWNIDGTSFIQGSPNGHFATTRQNGILNMLLLADLNGDKSPEIVGCANDDPFMTYQVQRIYAWDKNGEVIDGFPLVAAGDISTGYRYTPTIGDINRDDFVDLAMPSADGSLIFVNLPGQTFRECAAPAPHWRYNRRLNNIAPGLMSCDPTDIGPEQTPLPVSYSLAQNYPNPFNPSTVINFSLPVRTPVSISIYNILGRRIGRLVDKTLPAGNYRITWDGRDFKGNPVSSGIYLYHMKAGDFSETRKMLLIK